MHTHTHKHKHTHKHTHTQAHTHTQSATTSKVISLQAYINSLSDAQYNTLRSSGLIVDGRVPKSQAAITMEPEYIALGGNRAYVTLQVRSTETKVLFVEGHMLRCRYVLLRMYPHFD